MTATDDHQPRYTTKRLHNEVAKAKEYARRVALEEAASLIEANMLVGDDNEEERLIPRSNPGNKLGFGYATAIRALAGAPAPAPQMTGWEAEEKLSVEEAWTILCETPDITSPEEYPDHALITMEQLGSFMDRAKSSAKESVILAFEKAYPELYWHVAKGKVTAGEPLYGAIITSIRGEELGHGESAESARAAFVIAVSDAGLTLEGQP